MKETKDNYVAAYPIVHVPPAMPMPSLPDTPITMPLVGTANQLRGEHDPITMARASQIHARGDIVVFGCITGALVFLFWLTRGGDLVLYGLAGLIVWGCVSYFALGRNRDASYKHSPAGVALNEQEMNRDVMIAEIESRERIATHVINKHVELVEKQFRLGRGE